MAAHERKVNKMEIEIISIIKDVIIKMSILYGDTYIQVRNYITILCCPFQHKLYVTYHIHKRGIIQSMHIFITV